MIFFERFHFFYKMYYQRNLYFSVLFLFAWVVFSGLRFLHVNIFLRLVVAIFLFIALLFFWDSILLLIFKQRFFQIYLWSFFLIYNKTLLFPNGPYILGFFLGLFSFLVLSPLGVSVLHIPLGVFGLNNKVFVLYFPNFELFYLFIFLFRLFERFNLTVIIAKLKEGLTWIFILSNSSYFGWEDILETINSFFDYKFIIPNLLSAKPSSFNYYSFPKSCMDRLSCIGLNKSYDLYIELEEKCKKEGLNIKDCIEKMLMPTLSSYLKERKTIIISGATISEHITLTFNSYLLRGFYFSGFLTLFFFNFY